MHLSRRPVHPPLRVHICAPALQHALRTKWDNGHSTCVPGRQRAQENYQRLRGTCGLPS